MEMLKVWFQDTVTVAPTLVELQGGAAATPPFTAMAGVCDSV